MKKAHNEIPRHKWPDLLKEVMLLADRDTINIDWRDYNNGMMCSISMVSTEKLEKIISETLATFGALNDR